MGPGLEFGPVGEVEAGSEGTGEATDVVEDGLLVGGVERGDEAGGQASGDHPVGVGRLGVVDGEIIGEMERRVGVDGRPPVLPEPKPSR